MGAVSAARLRRAVGGRPGAAGRRQEGRGGPMPEDAPAPRESPPGGAPPGEGEDELPAGVRAAGRDPRVLAALGDVFRRNCRDARGVRREFASGEAEALAREAVERLCHPDAFRLADVGGLRLHLEVPSETHPGSARIHANAWDDDEGVWRAVGQIDLPVAGAR